MVYTLRTAIEQTEDRAHRNSLMEWLTRMNQHSATGDLGEVVVKTKEEMGSSAGICFANGTIHYRDDNLKKGNKKQAAVTIIHEEEHRRRNIMEGLAEGRGLETAGLKTPTPDLVDQVEAGNEIIEFLGKKQTYELARQGEKGPIALEQALVQKFVGGLLGWAVRLTSRSSVHEQKVAEAKKKAHDLVTRAKDYKQAA
jgi:hypothetical protein